MPIKKEMKAFSTYHLIKSEDLNHHGTLYAGRSAEWFVEAGFIAASALLNPHHVICLKIHGMYFSSPVRLGQSVCYTSRIAYTGKSSLVAHIGVSVINSDEVLVEGFITFVHVDTNTIATPHGIEIVATNEHDLFIQNKAKNLKKMIC